MWLFFALITFSNQSVAQSFSQSLLNKQADAPSLPGAARQDFLPPEQVFKPEIFKASESEINLIWEINPDYYLYKDKIHITPLNQNVDIADIIADTPASDTRVIDIHELSTIADVFVICSGENERQLRAIFRRIADGMAENGVSAKRIEGEPSSGWVLMDFGDVIVHVFDEELRAFYNLEDRWSGAPVMLSIQ